MSSSQRILAQLALGVFVLVLIIPIIAGKLTVLTAESTSTDILADTATSFWLHRLAEVYLHLIFLAASIVASILVIRKPPDLLPMEEVQ